MRDWRHEVRNPKRLGGSIVNLLLISIGHAAVPLPEGTDMTTPESMKESMKLLTAKDFVFPLLAHGFGTFVGAFCASIIAACYKFPIAMAVGVFFLAGGTAMVLMVGGPVWFIALDLIGAYLPTAYLAKRLASGGPSEPDPAPEG